MKSENQTIPPTRYSRFARWILDCFVEPSYRRAFHGTYFHGLSDSIGETAPILVVSNHMSWWDAFVLLKLQKVVRPRSAIYTIALEETLQANPFLGRVGLIPLNPLHPSGLRSLLRRVREILDRHRLKRQESGPLFLFFPQGKIRPAWAQPLEFKAGVGLLQKEFEDGGLIVPVGIMIEPLNQKRPSVFVSCGTPLPASSRLGHAALEKLVSVQLSFIAEELRSKGEGVLQDSQTWKQLL